MQDKRIYHRLLCAELVELNYSDTTGRAQHCTVNLEDISITGLCVQTDVKIPDQSPVRVGYKGGEFAGVVRYCNYRDGSYFVGIEFENDSRWSQLQYCPEHLLDPTNLCLEV